MQYNKKQFYKVHDIENRQKKKNGVNKRTVLKGQSNYNYIMYKENNLYYIENRQTGKNTLIGNKEQSEDFILYGIPKEFKI